MKNFSKPSEPRIVFLFVCALFITGCTKTATDRLPHSTPGKPAIVSLAPSITEMIYAIGAGDQLVGRTSACDWPPEVKNVAIVGAFGRPSLETLAALSPDIVIDIDLAEENIGKKITDLGIRRENLAIRIPEDIPPALRKLGRLTGKSTQADSLAEVIEKGLAENRALSDTLTSRPKVYMEIWDDPLWTGGKSSYVSALVTYAGGANIGDAVEKEYFEISPEWVISRNPDMIACMYMSKQGDVAEKVASRPGWEHIGAVKNGTVFDNLDNNIFLRPGPRVLEGIEQLRHIIDAASDER